MPREREPPPEPELIQSEEFYDWRERAQEKQRAREEDEADLAAGRVTVAELQERNGFIPGDIARTSKILSWGIPDEDG